MRNVFHMKHSPLLVRRFVPMMMAAAATGTAAAVTGLYISYHFKLPAGPAMTLVASIIFALSVAFRRRAPARESSSRRRLVVSVPYVGIDTRNVSFTK